MTRGWLQQLFGFEGIIKKDDNYINVEINLCNIIKDMIKIKIK